MLGAEAGGEDRSGVLGELEELDKAIFAFVEVEASLTKPERQGNHPVGVMGVKLLRRGRSISNKAITTRHLRGDGSLTRQVQRVAGGVLSK